MTPNGDNNNNNKLSRKTGIDVCVVLVSVKGYDMASLEFFRWHLTFMVHIIKIAFGIFEFQMSFFFLII